MRLPAISHTLHETLVEGAIAVTVGRAFRFREDHQCAASCYGRLPKTSRGFHTRKTVGGLDLDEKLGACRGAGRKGGIGARGEIPWSMLVGRGTWAIIRMADHRPSFQGWSD